MEEARSLRFRSRTACVRCALALTICTVGVSAVALRQQDASTQTHSEAAKLTSPVTADLTSLAAGKKLYDVRCASCHGPTGKGDGKEGELLNPKPADFTDAIWLHGSTDGEIFTVIRNGSKQTGMAAFGSRMTSEEIWNLVNYVRSLGPNPTQP